MSEMTIDTPFFFALFPSFISAEYRSITYDGPVAIKQLKFFLRCIPGSVNMLK